MSEITVQELKQKQENRFKKDMGSLEISIDEYRRKTGIPMSLFIEMLATITQNYRLMQEIRK